MLGKWRSHAEYQNYLIENIAAFFINDSKLVKQYESALSKLYLLDLDELKPILEPFYSHTGTPANNQPELIGSFILMSELKIHSITEWVDKLKHNSILCAMIGLDPSHIHGVGSYYDLINQVWLQNPDIQYEFEHSTHTFKRKPSKKLKKNKKQPPRHPGIIQKFVDLALQGKTFESRPERLIQQIFAKIGVEPSAKEGLYGDTKKCLFQVMVHVLTPVAAVLAPKSVTVRKMAIITVIVNVNSPTLMPVGVGIATMNSGFTVIQNIFFLYITKI